MNFATYDYAPTESSGYAFATSHLPIASESGGTTKTIARTRSSSAALSSQSMKSVQIAVVEARFLAEYERRMSDQAEDERSAAWQLAVTDYADQLDPMCRPERIAKDLQRSDETLERLVAEAEKARRR